MDDLDFTPQEAQFIITAADAFVRQTGLANAALGLSVVTKIQAAASGGAALTSIEGGASDEESAAEGA